MLRVALLGLVAWLGCTKANPARSCADGDCSDPNFPFCDLDGVLGDEPLTCVAVSCTPNEVLGCRDELALVCNSSGDSVDATACPGGDCVAGVAPHCPYIEPRYVPDICDAPPSNDSLVLSGTGTFDPNLDSNCTGGVVRQAGAAELCVVYYGSITVTADATITIGTRSRGMGRVIAFVADGIISIEGELDASANGSRNGAGGGRVQSGEATTFPEAPGGAGGRTAGGDGGNPTQAGGADNGGEPAENPATLVALVGGAAALQSTDSNEVDFGGGGGGLSLISCRGTVSVSGIIDLGGGGGLGGSGTIFKAGFGGGAGGVLVLQGVGIEVTGEIYSNGGAGGRGVTATGAAGDSGEDGSRSATKGASGSPAKNGEGIGGTGGFSTNGALAGGAPTNANAFAGGGGGSAGFILTFTPEGVEPTLDPIAVSPPFEPNGTLNAR
jgi:hypothetical protein